VRKVENLFTIQSSRVAQGSLSASSEPLNSPLILDRQEIIRTLKTLGVPENINDFKKDVLEKIIAKQAGNLPTDENGKPVVIMFITDRDHSITDGRDVLSLALLRNMSLEEFQAHEPENFKQIIDYLKIAETMNLALGNFLRIGVPFFIASGALRPEALNRINNGEAPPTSGAWSTGTENSLLKGFDNKGEVYYGYDSDYDNLLQGSVKYDKSFVVEKLRGLIANHREYSNVYLRFQPSMDDISRNKFITSLHLNTTLAELKLYRDKVQKSLGDQYLVKADIDAEGDSLRASEGGVTQMYINIEPKKVNGNVFDGKETFFSYMDDLMRNTASEQKLMKNKKPEIVTFGIADSDNDTASITSPLTKGLAIIPSNAIHIRDPKSKLMQKLSEIPNELKTSLEETLIAQGATIEMAKKLSNSVKVVSQNPSRFIYFTEAENPDEKMSLSINNGYKVLHALIYLGKFTQE
jgi:hypothetical protein